VLRRARHLHIHAVLRTARHDTTLLLSGRLVSTKQFDVCELMVHFLRARRIYDELRVSVRCHSAHTRRDLP
jgi:predicted DNA-binding protein with PD1-like motif